jgi:hypothetical protein
VIEALRKEVTRMRTMTLWGTKYRRKPGFLDTPIGDGKKLVAISWLGGKYSRPNYMVVMGDSSWHMSNRDDEEAGIMPRDWLNKVCLAMLDAGWDISQCDGGCEWWEEDWPSHIRKAQGDTEDTVGGEG